MTNSRQCKRAGSIKTLPVGFGAMFLLTMFSLAAPGPAWFLASGADLVVSLLYSSPLVLLVFYFVFCPI